MQLRDVYHWISFFFIFRRIRRNKPAKETRFFASDGHVLNINQGKWVIFYILWGQNVVKTTVTLSVTFCVPLCCCYHIVGSIAEQTHGNVKFI